MKDTKINGAKSIVMQPMYAAKQQEDRKKSQNLIRKTKHKGKIEW